MNNKNLFSHIFLKNQKAVKGFKDSAPLGDGDALALARGYEQKGADALIIFDLSEGDAEHDKNLDVIREIGRNVGIGMYGGGNIRREEDVKKLLYAGCEGVFLNMAKPGNAQLLEPVSKRFGREKTGVSVSDFSVLASEREHLREYADFALLFGNNRHLYETVSAMPIKTVPMFFTDDRERLSALLRLENVVGVSGAATSSLNADIGKLRREMAAQGVPINSFESEIPWEELKLNEDGLIPVVVQDYRNNQVLMLAYMDKEAFERTLLTGRMNYHSRSRNTLWLKGETSGHYQYVKQLSVDCDNDTLLARVAQVGAACHTGNRSCFYRDMVPCQHSEKNPQDILNDVMAVIQDRRIHPKEGSYTNYLFDKGLDKILKKVGEEATEIIIAAKNPNPEEIKYEACDFLYHLMVLMAERGVTWDEIMEELAKR